MQCVIITKMRNPSFSSFSLFSNPPPTHPRQVASYKKQAEELYKAANPDANIDDPNEDDWEGRPTSESPFVPAPPPSRSLRKLTWTRALC